jgi:hypothetical protein
MGATQQIRRVVFAFVISMILNGGLLAVAFSIDPKQENLSRTASIANALLRPAGALTEYLAPGHSGAQIVMLFVTSVLFCTAVAWVVLSLPVWWRSRT